jgi:D-galactarolactone cycloisomerase
MGPPGITKAYLDLIAPHFIDRKVYGFEHATSAILSTYYQFGIQNQMTSCLSGIDIACLDAIGKMVGLAIVKLLGGPARDRLPIYASSDAVAAAVWYALGVKLMVATRK